MRTPAKKGSPKKPQSAPKAKRALKLTSDQDFVVVVDDDDDDDDCGVNPSKGEALKKMGEKRNEQNEAQKGQRMKILNNDIALVVENAGSTRTTPKRAAAHTASQKMLSQQREYNNDDFESDDDVFLNAADEPQSNKKSRNNNNNNNKKGKSKVEDSDDDFDDEEERNKDGGNNLTPTKRRRPGKSDPPTPQSRCVHNHNLVVSFCAHFALDIIIIIYCYCYFFILTKQSFNDQHTLQIYCIAIKV